MSQNTASTALRLCRACRHKLQRSNQLQHQQRTFTSTQQRQKTIPTFQPTSSSELDAILLEVRNKIFLPEIVNSTVRKLIYRPARQQILLNEPGVTQSLSDGTEIQVMPLGIHDRPKKHQTLFKILELMIQTGQWENLPTLLEGLKLSKQHPEKTDWFPKLIRKASEVGQFDIILKCAQNGEKTGVLFTNPDVVREIIPALHNAAVSAEWKGEDLDRINTLVENLVSIIYSTASTHKLRTGQDVDYRKSPEVLGLILELAVAKAQTVHGGKDTDGKVLNYVQKLDVLWPFGDYTVNEKHPSQTLSWLVPMWNAVRQALAIESVAKSPAGLSLKEKFQDLDRIVQEAKEKCAAEAKGKPRRGLKMYNAVV